MFTLLSVPMRAEEITIGSGNTTNAWLPSHSYYKYSLTQQIYTAEEIGDAGEINSIAFYNGGSEKTRTYDVYLVNTEKSSFSGVSDWISVTSNDLVFSGSVTIVAGDWTTLSFTSPFQYEGDNLAVVVNDKTGSYSQGMECRVFTPDGDQGVVSLYASKDGSVNYDLSNPGNASGTVTFKNQIILDIESAAVTCAKPKSLTATNVSAHTATLTWQPGAEGQSNWEVYVTTTATDIPDENTTPTYQVTECSKALVNLTTQTTYYAYVRANCGDGDKSKWASTSFTTTREALTVDAANPYSQGFEENNDWTFSNGTFTNQWCWGSATNNGGEKSIYISDDNGAHNNYSHSALVVYASKLFNFSQGTYTFSFDWNAKGESSYDFIRVALIPGDKTFTAGGSLPSGVTASGLPNTWIALDGGSKLNLSDDWQTKVTEEALSGTYTMVFLWRNDGGGGSQPPAAIDNISINYMTCPRPTNLAASNITGRTATLSWTENGTATNWVLQYATDAAFTDNLASINVSGTASQNVTGLSPETKYYARVKSILGSDESSWSDVTDFTTTATCEKPTLSYVQNSNTAHTGSVSWTGSADNYELIYSTAYSFEPGDEGVTQINLGSVNTYTLQDLDPETTYRIKVRANCGAEDGYSQWSNQVSFTTMATCVAPSGLSATATSSSITLSWMAGATGQDAWDIRYKANTDSEYSYVHLDNQTTTSYTITDLTPVTAYSVNVRAYCSDTDQSKWGYSTNQNSDLTVTTECGALSLPFTYGFEEILQTTSPYTSSNPFPKCWSRIAYQSGYYGSYTYYPYVFTATTSQPYAHGGNGANSYSGHSLRFYQTSSSTNECAVLPEISSEYEMQKIQLTFWAAVQSSSGTLKIGTMSSPTDASTFTQIEELTVSNTYSDGFVEYTVLFENYSGDGRYIAFMCGTGSSYAYFLIDDVTVDVTPACLVPNDPEVSDITESEANLTWTPRGGEDSWEVQYKKSSDIEWGESIVVNDTSTCMLTGLQRATGYDVRVRSKCQENEQSDWTNTVNFETECGILPVDSKNAFSEDFEAIDASDFPPTCWEKFSHEMTTGYTYWYLNSNNGLGSSAAFSYWSEGYAFLVMPKMHLNGNAILSFDYLIGSGTYNESCAVVVSTSEMTYSGFNQTIWEADGNNIPSGKANATVSLADFDGEEIYIAFKFKGSGTSGCTWYIDNVNISVAVNQTQTIALEMGYNNVSTCLDVTLDEIKAALVATFGETTTGIKIIAPDGTGSTYSYKSDIGYYWRGNVNNWDVTQFLTIYAPVAPANTLVLEGERLGSVGIAIVEGYNSIAYTCDTEMSFATAFAGFEAISGDMVIAPDGTSATYTLKDGSYIWRGTLSSQNLMPGTGYTYFSVSATPRTLTFPSGGVKK